MRRRALVTWFAAVVIVASAGCGDLAWERGRVLLWWEAHEMLFAMSPQRARLDAYRLHGGVLWTGGLELPPHDCFDTLRFDPASARLWVFGEAGGLLVDARGMRVLARWQGGEAPLPPPPTAFTARSGAGGGEVCPGPRLAHAAGVQ